MTTEVCDTQKNMTPEQFVEKHKDHDLVKMFSAEAQLEISKAYINQDAKNEHKDWRCFFKSTEEVSSYTLLTEHEHRLFEWADEIIAMTKDLPSKLSNIVENIEQTESHTPSALLTEILPYFKTAPEFVDGAAVIIAKYNNYQPLNGNWILFND